MLIFSLILVYILKNKISNYTLSFSKKCIAYFVYFLVIFGRIPFLYTDITENKVIKAMLVASLRVFMSTLRKKIETGTESPQYIQTHIGVGYRMLKVE